MSAKKQKGDLRQRVPADRMEMMKVEYERYDKMLSAASKKVPEQYAPFIKKLAPVGAAVIVFLKTVIPLYIRLFQWLYKMYNQLPQDIMVAVYGFALCFFGGHYATLIAAVETFRNIGWDPLYKAGMELWTEFQGVKQANELDNTRDDNNDGIADVDQIEADKLLVRKTQLFFKTADPVRMNTALAAIYTGCMGVIAALKVKFAKTVMLGISLSKVLKRPADKFLVPLFKKTIDEEYHKWIDTVVGYVCKVIAVSVVWSLQRVISAFHSAIKGGLMCSRSVIAYLNKSGKISINSETTYVDEAVGVALAALGIYLQVIYGFRLPFPLNILFWPLDIMEWAVTWTVSSD